MDNIIGSNENLVNYTTISTAANNQAYQTPTEDPQSLSFKIKDGFWLDFSIEEEKDIEAKPEESE